MYKRFLRNILAFCLLVISILALFVVFFFHTVTPQYTEIYTAAMIDKAARLYRTEGSRIVLIGNSNLAFGIDSSLIEEAFGMPVVNMGMHGGFGNPFDEQVCRLSVHEGDIYVIAHHTYADDDTIQNPELVWMTIEDHRELWPLIRKQDYSNMARAFPRYAFKATVRWLRQTITGREVKVDGAEGFFARDAFNEYGDDAYPRYEVLYEFDETSVEAPKINDTCIERMNELNAWLNEHGAMMVVAGYPIGSGEFTPPAEVYEAFEEELRSALDCRVISHFTDYFFPYDMFYDSNLHLTTDGARLRTLQLIEDLRPVVQP